MMIIGLCYGADLVGKGNGLDKVIKAKGFLQLKYLSMIDATKLLKLKVFSS